MHLIRRAAFRAASSPATSFCSKPRSITTASPFLLRSKVQNGISSSVFRRFTSDEANSSERNIESADGEEHGSVRSAINSATESASTYASDAAERLTNDVEQAKESILDGAAAATGFAPRRDYDRNSRPAYGERNGNRQPYNSGGYNGDRGGLRPAVERNLTPTPGIYIGNLLFDITADDLTREFEQYGTVKSAIVAMDARGLSKGFGYIEFGSIEEATAAIEAKHQTVLEGRRLIVNYMAKTTRDNKPNPPSKTLFIGNLAFEMSDADLNKLFRDIQNVIDVRVAIDRRTGQPRGFAHADFVDVDSATKGLSALIGKEVYGRKLRVDYSTGRVNDAGFSGSRDGGERGRY